MILAAKEVTESNAPVGAALIAQAMDRREGAGRYKAMQSIVDWDPWEAKRYLTNEDALE